MHTAVFVCVILLKVYRDDSRAWCACCAALYLAGNLSVLIFVEVVLAGVGAYAIA